MSNEGKNVKVHYTGTLEDGTKFDSSHDRNEPIEFVCMSGQTIPGFDEAVKGLEVGETKKFNIPAAEAYGEYRDDLVQKVPLDFFGNPDALPLGQRIFMNDASGNPLNVLIADIVDQEVTLDLNHDLAGKDLVFEITLLEVNDA